MSKKPTTKPSSPKQVWVSPNPQGWSIKTVGRTKPSKITENKAEAVKIGTTIAKNNNAELVVQKGNGQIQDKNSFGNDPHPPKDKN